MGLDAFRRRMPPALVVVLIALTSTGTFFGVMRLMAEEPVVRTLVVDPAKEVLSETGIALPIVVPPASREFSDRPLLSSTRQPYSAPAPKVVEPEEPEEEVAIEEPEENQNEVLPVPRFSLLGTILQGESRSALVAVDLEQQSWLQVGETIAGWEIGSISQQSITLFKGEREIIVETSP